MVYRAYCYNTGRVTALLDEEEWADLEPSVRQMVYSIKDFRLDTGASIAQARERGPSTQAALDHYHRITGEDLEHPDQLWVVRLSLYGRHCPNCQKPFRTPKAKMCPECGYHLPPGEVAGPLVPPENENAP